jgi:hypothetical protein
MRVPLLVLLFALAALAQSPAVPEIRGTVIEFGTNAPIPAAEVVLYEFVTIDTIYSRRAAFTVVTDSRGAFTFKPLHIGNYFMEARKATYLTAVELDALGPIPDPHMAEIALTVNADPLPDIRFILIRPGGLTGRVIDENDKPVPNFTLTTLRPNASQSRSASAITDRGGVFTFPTLVPAPHVIRVGPVHEMMVPMIPSFTKEDIARVEQDFETTYWPGGVSDPAIALPAAVVPGTVANIGTIRVRKIPYYRAHLTFAGQCGPKESWVFTFANAAGIMLGRCGEGLIDKLLPGTHTIGIWSSGEQPASVATNWTIISFTVDRKNADVPVVFAPAVDVPGRIVNASGDKQLPQIGTMRIGLRPTTDFSYATQLRDVKTDPEGNFTMQKVAWPRHQVSVHQIPPGVAIQEIRYNNQRVTDGTIDLAAGALLEIVVDDLPAAITGTAEPSARIYAARWPFAGMASAPYLEIVTAEATGRFRIGSLAASEYRVIAVPSATPFIDPPTLTRLLTAAPRIILDRGAQQSIELKLSDPTR